MQYQGLRRKTPGFAINLQLCWFGGICYPVAVMSLRLQQIVVFFGTVVVIFSIFAGGVWLIAQRLTPEAPLQPPVLMARQAETALADSPRQRPAPQGLIVQSHPSSSFWIFLGNISPGVGPKPKPQYTPGRPPPRHA